MAGLTPGTPWTPDPLHNIAGFAMTPYQALTKARIAISRQGDMDRMSKDGETKMIARDGLGDTKDFAEAYNVLADIQEQMKKAPGDFPWDYQP